MSGGEIWKKAGASTIRVPAFTCVEFDYNEVPSNLEIVMAIVIDGVHDELSWKPLTIGEQAIIEQQIGAAWSRPVFSKYLPYVDVVMSARVINLQEDVSKDLIVTARVNDSPISDEEIQAIKDQWQSKMQELKDAG